MLAFIHVPSRRVILSPATLEPTGAWVEEHVQAFVEQARSLGLKVARIRRDRDSVFSKTFDAAVKSKCVADVESRLPRDASAKTAPSPPSAPGLCESATHIRPAKGKNPCEATMSLKTGFDVRSKQLLDLPLPVHHGRSSFENLAIAGSRRGRRLL